MLYSIIIPVYNEIEVLDELISRVIKVFETQNCNWEVVIVDDGSDDGSVPVLRNYEAAFNNLVLVELIRNYGQTIALRAGIETAKGDVIICMDGDLQHKPEEIPQFIKYINDNYDLVSGYKDNQSRQKISSKIAHFIIRKITGVNLKYFGATIKAFRREVLNTRVMTGNAHRYMGVFLARNAKNIMEIPLSIEQRNCGESKYKHGKKYSVLIELLSLKLISNEISRSSKTYKKIGFFLVFFSLFADVTLVMLDLFADINIKETFIVEFILINFLLMFGLLFFLFGILFELNSQATNTAPYIVRRK